MRNPSGDNAFKIELARRIVSARSDARRGGNAGAYSGASRLPLLHPFPERSSMPEIASPKLRPICGTARISVSR